MKAPQIGELDKLVLVRKWQDEPSEDDQGVDQTYDAGVKAWSRILPTGAALFYGTAQVETGVTHRLMTWRTENLNADVIGGSHVVDHAGMRYRVKRATDFAGKRAFVVLDLEQTGTIEP